MKLYNFKRLINKYSVTFCLHHMQGGYVGGKWEQGGERVESMSGAIVPIRDRKIYGSGGTYTEQDRELYVLKTLKAPLSDYKVVYKGNAYSVEDGRNFEDYADVMVYTLKWMSKVVTDHD
jgi:hypothetical protein